VFPNEKRKITPLGSEIRVLLGRPCRRENGPSK
jgi:hypothetical protein